MWDIQLLGGLVVRSADRTATRFRTQKTAGLLAYLAYRCRENAAPQPRERLVAMLWPEADLEAGRHNLSNALTALRHVLEPPGVRPGTILAADRASVRLNPAGVSTDVARFEGLARRIRDERIPTAERIALVRDAVAVYGGPLLPGFYEDWISSESERLAGLLLRMACTSAPLLLAAGDVDTLLAVTQAAMASDPCSEEAVELSMRAWTAAGDPTRALRQYRELERHLQEELGVRPSASLREHAARLEQLHRQRRSRPADAPRSAMPVPSAEPKSAPAAEMAPAGILRGPAFTTLTVTRFFGREEETGRLAALIGSPRTRLVTVTGPGGTGKTRLALETASRLIEPGPGATAPFTSATFVALAEVPDGERLPETVLRCLGGNPQPGVPPLEQVAALLRQEAAPLLILDNFEHLVEGGAMIVPALLAAAPHARCIVTSRQKLLLEGEHELRLDPLPAGVEDLSPATLAANPSVQLFVDRAQMLRPDFQLTRHHAAAVAQLCAYLEGVPLALELAAARISLLTPTQILAGIRLDRLDFLVSRRRDAVARHRSMRAVLDWSFELLPPSAGRLLAELSVFRAGFTLEAAEVVCPETTAGDCLELMSVLRDASLIGLEHGEEGLRFTLLETVRQYAEERLAAAGSTERVQSRHGEYFLEWSEIQRAQLYTLRHGEALRRLARDQENLGVALEWAVRIGRPLPRARFCVALATFWKTQGIAESALAWYNDVIRAAREEALQRAMVEMLPRPVLIQLLLAINMLCSVLGRAEDQHWVQRWALDLATLEGDPALRAEALLSWAMNPTHGGYAGTLAVLEEGLQFARAARDERSMARIRYHQAHAHRQLDQREEAWAAQEEALALFRKVGDPTGIGDLLRNRGYLRLHYDIEVAACRADFEENLAIRHQIGDLPGVALGLLSLAQIVKKEGDREQVVSILEQSAAILEQCGWSRSSQYAAARFGLAYVAWELNRHDQAWAAGRQCLEIFLHLRQAVRAAECTRFLAEVALTRTHVVEAARLAGAAERLNAGGRAVCEVALAPLPVLLARLSAALGDVALGCELEHGRRLTDVELLALVERLSLPERAARF